ncbi:MAG TPA: hypothetical protein VK859_12040, partial [bacterium]|nr:hypothetical protein [bacterium]
RFHALELMVPLSWGCPAKQTRFCTFVIPTTQKADHLIKAGSKEEATIPNHISQNLTPSYPIKPF